MQNRTKARDCLGGGFLCVVESEEVITLGAR